MNKQINKYMYIYIYVYTHKNHNHTTIVAGVYHCNSWIQLDITKPLITCTATSALAVSRPKPVARATILAEGTTSHPAMAAAQIWGFLRQLSIICILDSERSWLFPNKDGKSSMTGGCLLGPVKCLSLLSRLPLF